MFDTGKPTRRTVAKAAGWAVPVVAVGAAAPVVAASPAITYSAPATFHAYYRNAPWCGTTGATRSGLSVDSAGLSFANTRPWTTITGVYLDLYFTRSDITWTTVSGPPCWSALTYTGSSTILDGRTYYIYRTTYGCTITPINGTTTLPGYEFHSQCYNWTTTAYDNARWIAKYAYATVNGSTALSYLTGPLQITGS